MREMRARTENTNSGLLVPREKKLMMRGLVFGGLLVPCEKINGVWPPVPRDKGARPPVGVEKKLKVRRGLGNTSSTHGFDSSFLSSLLFRKIERF
jgi:hypothetical protein